MRWGGSPGAGGSSLGNLSGSSLSLGHSSGLGMGLMTRPAPHGLSGGAGGTLPWPRGLTALVLLLLGFQLGWLCAGPMLSPPPQGQDARDRDRIGARLAALEHALAAQPREPRDPWDLSLAEGLTGGIPANSSNSTAPGMPEAPPLGRQESHPWCQGQADPAGHHSLTQVLPSWVPSGPSLLGFCAGNLSVCPVPLSWALAASAERWDPSACIPGVAGSPRQGAGTVAWEPHKDR